MRSCFNQRNDDRPRFSTIVSDLGNLNGPIPQASYYNKKAYNNPAFAVEENIYMNRDETQNSRDSGGMEIYANQPEQQLTNTGFDSYENESVVKNLKTPGSPPPRIPKKTYKKS